VERRDLFVERADAGGGDSGALSGDGAAAGEDCCGVRGTAEFERVFAEVYPQCENISIDYAVLEPRSAKGEMGSEIYCLPADFGWNDLGSWAALHEHLTDGEMYNECSMGAIP
jgi:mannose-1-phosphate guanylyltransferase